MLLCTYANNHRGKKNMNLHVQVDTFFQVQGHLQELDEVVSCNGDKVITNVIIKYNILSLIHFYNYINYFVLNNNKEYL